MTRKLFILILLFPCSLIVAQQKPVKITYGVKTGFSSTIYDVQELSVLQTPISYYISHSEISMFYTAFARLNIHRHYIQSECSYNISNYAISFNTNEWCPKADPSMHSTIDTKIIGLEVPIYYGYHIIKDASYGMSFYIGPKAKFVLTNYSRHTFESFPFEDIEETIYPINFSLMIGMGINISPVFFDFSFEYGLHNISHEFITTMSDGTTATDALVFDRRKNVLSFSIGFMF